MPYSRYKRCKLAKMEIHLDLCIVFVHGLPTLRWICDVRPDHCPVGAMRTFKCFKTGINKVLGRRKK